ncbi:MAG: methylenetetrahydrofolate--tRNA-(uracil(54)-C(5))-methyltransferase (FADH(2)-oxidizing) TrmFO [Actinobacteria bacterium]|nr:methylenetetrahydrofolate--tRNA-(uracil(54)-C(5))-methyltransferase (FADH(2)-oxidizing) TrmFO [Actinomycetota bacterium]
MSASLTVIGGGLAGSEAAWQAAEHGLEVRLLEMRPDVQTGAHQTSALAELVCSNSLGSLLPDRAGGILMGELRRLGSLLLACAEASAIPAGGALAVDREAFAARVTAAVESNPRIHVIREEALIIPDGLTVVASGPLTSPRLSESLARLMGEEHLYFFDALAPIVEGDSLDRAIAFRASRYERGQNVGGDYWNCPLTKDEYEAFVDALLSAERIPLRDFEAAIESGVRAGMDRYFEGCLPIEVIARRGRQSLAFGPMRPVGLIDPRSDSTPHAVVQLRQDNQAGSLYNLVGFQTNLTYAEQRRVLQMIPGLEHARFARFGQMHRNTFLNAPRLLRPTLQWRGREDLFFAGQITGVEGYLGNIATGLLAGRNAARLAHGLAAMALPPTTMLGALCSYVAQAEAHTFQPMKANLGILPPLAGPRLRGRRERAQALAERAQRDLVSGLAGSADVMRIATH